MTNTQVFVNLHEWFIDYVYETFNMMILNATTVLSKQNRIILSTLLFRKTTTMAFGYVNPIALEYVNLMALGYVNAMALGYVKIHGTRIR